MVNQIKSHMGRFSKSANIKCPNVTVDVKSLVQSLKSAVRMVRDKFVLVIMLPVESNACIIRCLNIHSMEMNFVCLSTLYDGARNRL